MRTVVLDTNVLLSNPAVLTDFPDAEVVIPDTVLAEIDKLKTARVDADLRYKGREVSRMLFELSETGPLPEGVDLPTGGRLRVVQLDSENSLPEGLAARNSDDRILGVALQLKNEGRSDLTLVTNDLNMLLKAQNYGIDVERMESVDSFSRRFIVRPVQRYRGSITILAVALAVFAAVVYLVAFSPLSTDRQAGGIASVPGEFTDQLSLAQNQILGYLYTLKTDPGNIDAQRALANLYMDMADGNATYVPLAIKHYEAALKLNPADNDMRTDLASAYFRQGRVDVAIQQLVTVLRSDPNHINANYNLGILYMATKPKEYQKAANQFQKVIDLTKNSPSLIAALGQARTRLDQTIKEATAAGQPVKLNGGTL